MDTGQQLNRRLLRVPRATFLVSRTDGIPNSVISVTYVICLDGPSAPGVVLVSVD